MAKIAKTFKIGKDTLYDRMKNPQILLNRGFLRILSDCLLGHCMPGVQKKKPRHLMMAQPLLR